MSRQARKFSATGFYHIVFLGVKRQHIFEDKSGARVDLGHKVTYQKKKSHKSYCSFHTICINRVNHGEKALLGIFSYSIPQNLKLYDDKNKFFRMS